MDCSTGSLDGSVVCKVLGQSIHHIMLCDDGKMIIVGDDE